MQDNQKRPGWKPPHHLTILGCVALMGVLLLNGSDGVGGLNALFLLLCPLMHLWMMKGTGKESQSRKDASDRDDTHRSAHKEF